MARIIRGIVSVLFGCFPQEEDGKVKPIEWEVLKQDNNNALLVSKRVLDYRDLGFASNKWANSEIRKWLNDDFINLAFTNAEKAAILETELLDVKTTDKVFVLSKKETMTFYNSIEARCKISTPLVDARYYEERARLKSWLLRTPCHDHWSVYIVSDTGIITKTPLGFRVHVSPALWVNLDADIFKNG